MVVLARAVLLPSRAEQDQPGLAAVDVHRHGPAPRRPDDHFRLVLVELGLGDPDRLVKVLVWQLGVDDLVAVVLQVRRLDAARHRLPAVEEEDFHRRRWASFARTPVSL